MAGVAVAGGRYEKYFGSEFELAGHSLAVFIYRTSTYPFSVWLQTMGNVTLQN